jgi:alkylhydroperoxidase family enzyme
MTQYILHTPGSHGQTSRGLVDMIPNGPLDARHIAVLAYTDAMTLSVAVSDHVFDQLKLHFSEREVVEITATIAAYNCVSRFLVALDVGEKN